MLFLEELKYLSPIEKILILLDIIASLRKKFRLIILDKDILTLKRHVTNLLKIFCFVERNLSAIRNIMV